ncbi:MAG: Gfo/Idh/MocA family oxidoreductase [Candidatus Omnitrophica bacterium]|nr:Gfo/Idh/MocA family oxidoreductase [Candidatus Omnitrophota bacterium]MBU1870162.1 Gfo/Idh/MocA family oxidoreductase [Candidatus Omnitrophota bacterium]
MVNIGIIGCGHWGPNHIRNFSGISGCSVVACCDLDNNRLNHIKKIYPLVKAVSDYKVLLKDKSIIAVVISTPTSTHYRLAKEALLSGKDVLCEKPLALNAKEARELVFIARQKKRILMVGHVFLFNSGIQKMKEYIKNKTLGEIYYMRATRTNLGPIRNDVNVALDLAVHDISIFSFLLEKEPVMVNATGTKILRKNLEDIAFISLHYPGSVLANIQVSWLDPRKVREITVVGEKKMAVWDDLSATDMLRIYDKGVIREPYYDNFGEFQLLIREGEVAVPKINATEPLRVQSQHFIDSVLTRKNNLCDGNNGLSTTKVLEAVQKSLARNGEAVKV